MMLIKMMTSSFAKPASLEEYRETVKRRRAPLLAGAAAGALIVVLGLAAVPVVCAGMEQVYFLSGLLTGMGSAIAAACLVAVMKLNRLLKDEQALKNARLEELDERNQAIQKTACTVTLLAAMVALIAAVVVFAFVDMAVFRVLYICMLGLMLLYVVVLLVCRRMM